VIALVTRIAATLALLAAGFWVALPVVVVASTTSAHAESTPCACCEEQAALGGIIACVSCQVGVPAESAPPVRHAAVTAAWLNGATTLAPGIDPAPAEPPPR
jgi:hypothetical protein